MPTLKERLIRMDCIMEISAHPNLNRAGGRFETMQRLGEVLHNGVAVGCHG